jgi:hypothetical protein
LAVTISLFNCPILRKIRIKEETILNKELVMARLCQIRLSYIHNPSRKIKRE